MTAVYVFSRLENALAGGVRALWQQTLKRKPLSFAYSNKGICTLWSCLFGLFFSAKVLTPGKAIGIVVVLCGVWLVVERS
jgi:multidrug transporter EmrE-like cation transporter